MVHTIATGTKQESYPTLTTKEHPGLASEKTNNQNQRAAPTAHIVLVLFPKVALENFPETIFQN